MELRREVNKPLGLVWVYCTDSVLALGLKETLRQHAHVCCSTNKAPVGLSPSLVIVPAGHEGAVREVGRVREMAPHAPVVVLGFYADLALTRAAMDSGAKGFVHAGMHPEQIVRALSMVRKGEVVVPRELISSLVAQEKREPELPPLTSRQEEILELVAEGLTNAEIAERLFLSAFTVKQHLRAAYKTLGVKSRTHAVKLLRDL